MPDEVHEFPGSVCVAVFRASSSERGHTGKAHAVLDDPKNIAVRKFLRFVGPEIGRLGVKSAPNLRVATAVIAVANRAVVGEVEPCFALNFGRIRNWIFSSVRVGWGGHLSGNTRDGGLESAWLRPRAETIMQNADRRRGK